MEQAQMMLELALRRSSNLFNCNGVPMAHQEEHPEEVAYVANLFTIARALRERAIEEVL